jgi:ATP-dependent Lon protease
LKEKAVAAHRNRVAHVLIPDQNVRDLEELPQEVRDAVSFHPVKTMDEVLALALEMRPESRVRGESSTPNVDVVLPDSGMITH